MLKKYTELFLSVAFILVNLNSLATSNNYDMYFLSRLDRNYKLTSSKNRLLATFHFKMVAIKRNSVAKKTLGSGGHFMTYYTKGWGAERTFSTLRFASVKGRERRACLEAKQIYFNITKLLRPGNIANGAQNPFESIKFAILSRSSL